jgi:tetratricopeptide (TPR) repeat protein
LAACREGDMSLLVSSAEGTVLCFAEARAMALRALEINPELGEAEASLGWIAMNHDWDFAAAEQHFQRSVALRPHYGLAHLWYAYMLVTRGRDEEARAELAACREGDMSLLVSSAEGVVLSFLDRFEESVEFHRMTLATDPQNLQAVTFLGMALMFAEDFDEAESVLRQAIEISRGEETFASSLLAITLIRAGRTDEAREPMAHMDELARRRYVSRYHRTIPWVELDRYDRWGPLLEEAIAEREPYLAWIRPGKIHDTWLVDRRFSGPLRRAGLLP